MALDSRLLPTQGRPDLHRHFSIIQVQGGGPGERFIGPVVMGKEQEGLLVFFIDFSKQLEAADGRGWSPRVDLVDAQTLTRSPLL